MAGKRKYPFALPFHVAGLKLEMGLMTPTGKALLARLPADLQTEVKADSSGFFPKGLDVTAALLDRLPDDLYHDLCTFAGVA